MWRTLIGLVLLSACSAAHAARERESGREGHEGPAARGACDLLMTTKLIAKGRLQYSVETRIENTSKQSLSFVLTPLRCGAGCGLLSVFQT